MVVLVIPSYAMECAEFYGKKYDKNALSGQNKKGKNVQNHYKEDQLVVEFTASKLNAKEDFESYQLLSVELGVKRLDMVATQIQIIAKDPNATDILYHLGKSAYNAGRYGEGRLYFDKLVEIGFESSSKDILEMIRDGKIPTSLEMPTFRANQFLAIYILNGYQFSDDFNREKVKFSYGLPEMNNDTTTEGKAGFYTETLNNTGFVSFPWVWVKKSGGLDNQGVIETYILVVGNQVITGGKPLGNGFYRFEGFPRKHNL